MNHFRYVTECDLSHNREGMPDRYACGFCEASTRHYSLEDCDACGGSGGITHEDDDGDEYTEDCDDCYGCGRIKEQDE